MSNNSWINHRHFQPHGYDHPVLHQIAEYTPFPAHIQSHYYGHCVMNAYHHDGQFYLMHTHQELALNWNGSFRLKYPPEIYHD